MAIVVPIVSEWNPKGVQKSIADIQGAQGKWAKAGQGFRTAFLPAAGILGAAGAAGFTFAKKAEDAEKATRRLSQTLGNVKGIDQAAIDRQQELADTLEKSSAVDGEVIKGGQAILATFQSVGKTAGDVDGAFDRATQASLDLAAAGFGSVDGNAKQLGKALEDPVKGLVALKKSGVNFTQQQQDQIAAWVKSGDTAKAQNAILSEVEKQVGGTAAATATGSDKMANAWENAQESLGAILLPALDAGAALLERFAGWAEENKTVITVLAGIIAGFAGAIVAVNIAMKIWQAATVAFTAVQWLLNAAMTANPIGLVVVALAAIVAGLVIAYKKSETFRKIVDGALRLVGGAFTWLKDAAVTAFQWIKTKGFDFIVNIVKNSPLGLYIRGIFAAFRFLKENIGKWVGWLKDQWDKVIGFFRKFDLGKIWDSLREGFRAAINFIIRAWNNLDFRVPEIKLPFGKTFGGFTIGLPDIPEVGASSRQASPARTLNVTIQGAIDPEGTARQVRQLLADYDGNHGRTMPAVAL